MIVFVMEIQNICYEKVLRERENKIKQKQKYGNILESSNFKNNEIDKLIKINTQVFIFFYRKNRYPIK